MYNEAQINKAAKSHTAHRSKHTVSRRHKGYTEPLYPGYGETESHVSYPATKFVETHVILPLR